MDLKLRDDTFATMHKCTINDTVVGYRLELNRGFTRKLYDIDAEIVEPVKKLLGITEIASEIKLIKRKDSYYSEEEINDKIIVNEMTVLGELILSLTKNDFAILNM